MFSRHFFHILLGSAKFFIYFNNTLFSVFLAFFSTYNTKMQENVDNHTFSCIFIFYLQ